MGSRSYGGKKHHLRKRGEGRYSKEANDFVHFRIGIIDPTDPGLKARYMNFRSYIDSIPKDFKCVPPTHKYLISELVCFTLEMIVEANLSPDGSPVKINIFFILQ